jgi:DnaK suppressor protein
MATKKESSAGANLPLLPVAEGEEPWSAEEIAEVRAVLAEDAAQLRAAAVEAQAELASLMTEGVDGAGKDPADVGSSNFERDQELSLAANTREVADQTELALQRFDAGNYGVCESCGKPIGKARLMAFPRATLCLVCKQREERR